MINPKMKKAIEFIFAVLLVLVTIASAMSYVQWRQWGNTGANWTYNTQRENILFYPFSSSDTIRTNCSIADTSRGGAYIDPIYGKIWLLGTGVVSIYNSTCGLVAQASTGQTYLGSGYIIDHTYGANIYPEIVFDTRNSSGVVFLKSYVYNDTSQSLTLVRSIPFPSCSWATGVACDERSNICVLNCNDNNVKVVDMAAGTYVNASSSSFGTQTDVSVRGTLIDYGGHPNAVSTADIDNDGHREVLFTTIHDTNTYGGSYDQLYAGLWDITNSNFDSMGGVGSMQYAYGYSCNFYQFSWIYYSGAPCIIGNIGSPASTGEVLCDFGGVTQASGCSGGLTDNAKIFDTSFNQLFSAGYATTYQKSNFATGDIENDGTNEFCVIRGTGNVVCYDSDYNTVLKSCVIPESGGSYPYGISLLEYNSNSNDKEVATLYGIYGLAASGNCTKLYNLDNGLNDSTLHHGWFLPVDLNGDNAADLIYSDNISTYVYETVGSQFTCDDTDNLNMSYPTINYDVFGNVTLSYGDSHIWAPDCCIQSYNGSCVGSQVQTSLLREQWCPTANASEDNATEFDCTTEGKVCVGGQCVGGNYSGLSYYFDPFTWYNVSTWVSHSNTGNTTHYIWSNTTPIELDIEGYTGDHIEKTFVHNTHTLNHGYFQIDWGSTFLQANNHDVIGYGEDDANSFGSCTNSSICKCGVVFDCTFNNTCSLINDLGQHLINLTMYQENFWTVQISYERYSGNNTYKLYIDGQSNGTYVENSSDCANLGAAMYPSYGIMRTSNASLYQVSSWDNFEYSIATFANISSCTDSDGDTNPYDQNYTVKGTMIINGTSSYNDTCQDSGTLKEYTCDAGGGLPGVLYHQCSCVNGVCAGSGFCSDTDSATAPSDIPGTYGLLTTSSNVTYNDSCNGQMLTEYYCSNYSDPLSWNYKVYNCTALGGTCVGGACSFGNTTNSCNDTDSLVYPTRNYYGKGYVTAIANGIPKNSNDLCIDNSTLFETYCTSPTVPIIYNLTYNCSSELKACSNGACVQACSPDSCTNTCLYKDTFSYSCPLSQMGWTIYNPDNTLTPVSNRMCGNQSQPMDFIHSVKQGIYYDAGTEEFNLTLPNVTDSTVEVSLRYYDSTDRDFKTLYDFYFTVSGGYVVGGYQANENGIQTGESFPVQIDGIFQVNNETSIKIVHYNFDTYGRTFLNVTSNHTQAYLSGTYSIIVDNNPVRSFFNLNDYEPLIQGHSNMMLSTTVSLSNDTCIDDLSIYGGTNPDVFDLQPVPVVNVLNVKGCWDTKTGKFQCWVQGCQDCCTVIVGNNNPKVTDFMCVIGKSTGYELNKFKDWVLNNLIVFIIVMLVLILTIPVLLRILEILRGFKGGGNY